MLIRRCEDLELYQPVASDAALKPSLQQSIRGLTALITRSERCTGLS